MSTVITTTGGLTVVNQGRTYTNVSIGAYLSGSTVFFFINAHQEHAFSDKLADITLDGVLLSVAGFDALKAALNAPAKGKVKGAVSTVFNGIQANATSPVIDCSGYNAVLVSVNFTAGAGTGVFSFALQGKFDTGGVMMDIYDNNGNPLTTGNITTNQVKLFAAVPDFIQVVATEITDGATITVRVQPINI